jgi:hypothetical protein
MEMVQGPNNPSSNRVLGSNLDGKEKEDIVLHDTIP